MKCAVIIAAYNADKYILDCYESVKNQIPIPEYEIDIRVGVDGCQKTADVLRRAGIPHFITAIKTSGRISCATV